VDNWKNITNSQNSVRKKSFGGTFTFSNSSNIVMGYISIYFDILLSLFAKDSNKVL
jgi:hypothetical protein